MSYRTKKLSTLSRLLTKNEKAALTWLEIRQKPVWQKKQDNFLLVYRPYKYIAWFVSKTALGRWWFDCRRFRFWCKLNNWDNKCFRSRDWFRKEIKL